MVSNKVVLRSPPADAGGVLLIIMNQAASSSVSVREKQGVDMKTNIFDREDLAPEKILSRLRSLSDLPSSGFIAGGAVANTILTIIDKISYPINDIDIYYESSPGKFTSNMYRVVDPRLQLGLYNDFVYINEYSVTTHTFIESWRSGMLNNVFVDFGRWSRRNLSRLAKCSLILKGFDLNCCGAGLDLKSNTLIYTDDFVEFVETRQLKVSYPGTPAHTAVRLVKKQKDMNCYCNFDLEMEYLAYVLMLIDDPLTYKRSFSDTIYRDYQKYMTAMSKYFVVSEFSTLIQGNSSNPAHLLASGETMYTINPKRTQIRNELSRTRTLAELKIKWDLLNGYKNNQACKRILNHDGISRVFALINPDFIKDGNWDIKHLRRIDRFAERHGSLAYIFNKAKRLSLHDQLKAIQLIEYVAKREGQYVIGLIERARSIPHQITKEWIYSLVDQYKLKYGGQLKDREDLSRFKYAKYVEELITYDALHAEGKKMNHCVGGYVSAVKNNYSIIFHIEYEGESSTLEVYQETGMAGETILDISQHKAVKNSHPGDKCWMIADELISYLVSSKNARRHSDRIITLELDDWLECFCDVSPVGAIPTITVQNNTIELDDEQEAYCDHCRAIRSLRQNQSREAFLAMLINEDMEMNNEEVLSYEQ